MNYKVFYKSQKQLFWRKLKNVKGDGILESGSHRYFILENEVRIEIPLNYLFKFSNERFLMIKQNMEKEAGQKLQTNSKIDK